jgi:hypothetical protein
MIFLMEFYLIFPEKTINDAEKEGIKGEKKVLTEKSEQKKQQLLLSPQDRNC